MKAPPEKLGSFFLGSEYDIESSQITGPQVHYDSRDLTTHAVCIGMTGSGKTGLCICLLEEAALDKVPAIIIDPKGDITNHLLHFPDLKPSDFQEWVNVDDAKRKKITVEEYAKQVSELWKNGLERWGIEKSRITSLSDSVDYTIYTPGSSRGVSINVFSSLKAPKYTDPDALNNLITGTTAAILSLLNKNQDPVLSQEGILLSNILQYHWSRDQDLSLEYLIREVQNPPFERVGVFDLETFYPSEERIRFALQLNSIIASPNFSEWLKGDSLDISQLLFRPDGKPRHSIFSLAHLGDEERMFFVTLLLERLSTWMQMQSGTTSLRAIVYFDEVYGFMPPVANPPSKKPLLRLLKQGRAFGLGHVLTTQNPVDLDYKGLSNTGTWFIGKLQTERDKKRLLDGLNSINVGSNNIEVEDIIGRLNSRVFLLHNIHNNKPIIFHTRWAMNYLRGPLTGIQISKLMMAKKTVKTPGETQNITPSAQSTNIPPSVNPKIEQYYIETSSDYYKQNRGDGHSILNPVLLLNYSVRFYDKTRGIDTTENMWGIAPEPDTRKQIEWTNIENIDERNIHSKPAYSSDRLVYNELPMYLNNLEEHKTMRKDFSEYLYRNRKFAIGQHKNLKLYQEQGESRSDFIVKVKQSAREERDEAIDKIEKKYDSKLDRINTKIDRLTGSLSSNKSEYDARKREEVFGVGETVLGVLLGRRRTTGITAASRRRRMTTKTKNKIDETQKEIKDLKQELTELESELKEQVDDITDKWEFIEDEITEYYVTPRKADVIVNELKLAWVY